MKRKTVSLRNCIDCERKLKPGVIEKLNYRLNIDYQTSFSVQTVPIPARRFGITSNPERKNRIQKFPDERGLTVYDKRKVARVIALAVFKDSTDVASSLK